MKDNNPAEKAAATSSPALTYLAVPYSHPNPAIREARFRSVNRVAAALMAQGMHIFSPISHTHPIAIEGDLPGHWAYWQAYDRAMLTACKKLIVLKLDGWEQSAGIAGEISIAQELGIEIEYLDCDDPQPRTSAHVALQFWEPNDDGDYFWRDFSTYAHIQNVDVACKSLSAAATQMGGKWRIIERRDVVLLDQENDKALP